MIQTFYHSTQHSPDANRQVATFVSRVIWGDDRGFSPHMSMGVVRDGSLVAGVIFHDMDPDAGVIELSAGAVDPRWLTPRVIRSMYWLAFDFLGCQLAVHRVRASNDRMCRIFRRFGHNEYVIPRGAGRTCDLHLFTLTVEQWREHPVYRRGETR